jgi:hypothetical protein
MNFTKKKYSFRGMDGFAGFRRSHSYEIEVASTEPTDEQPKAEMVVINPVSRLYMYFSKQEFNEAWEKK